MKTTNPTLLAWLEQMQNLLTPDKVVWITGDADQIAALKAEGVSTGEMIQLNQEKLPDCYLHRTQPNDVARVEDRTFICAPTAEDAGPTNNWMDPAKAYEMANRFPSGQDRGGGHRFYLCGPEHEHHDPGRGQGPGGAG